MGRIGHLPLRRIESRDEVFSIDTPPPTVSGSLHVGHMFSYTHHGHHRPLPAHGRQGSVSTRWAGTTTACPPSGVCRTTTAFGATRRSRTTPTSRAPDDAGNVEGRRQDVDELAISRPNFVELCHGARGRGREGLRASIFRRLGTLRRLEPHLRDDQQTTVAVASRSSPSSRTSSGVRRTRSRHRRCGMSRSRPPWPRPSWRTRNCRAPYHKLRFARADGVPTSGSTPRDPSSSPRAWLSSPTPTTSGTSPLFGWGHRRQPGLRGRGSGPRPRARRPREGHRHRHDLHVRRHDRRHLVARARPSGPHRDRPRRASSPPRPPSAITSEAGREPPTTGSRGRRSPRTPRRRSS